MPENTVNALLDQHAKDSNEIGKLLVEKARLQKMIEDDVSLHEQIKAVGRELGMRRTLYPKWVSQNRLTQAKADAEIKAMQAVYVTLKLLEEDFKQ